ncbi:Protein of unknown function [Gryllus bimaculatus]|nr:Protein of unknown function [Gryllus bimaculatus]
MCGDLRTAVAQGALAVGCYCLLVGFIYLNKTLGFERWNVDYIVDTSWMIACIIATMNAALYYACKNLKNDRHLEYIMCATMSLYLVDVPFSILYYMAGVVTSPEGFKPLWLTIRIALSIVHLCLLYCLLVELHESMDPSPIPLLQPNAAHCGAVASDQVPKEENAQRGTSPLPRNHRTNHQTVFCVGKQSYLR